MKTQKVIWSCIFIFSFVSCSMFKNTTQDSRTLKQKIESKDFTIGISRSKPTDLVYSSFNSDVCVKLKADIASADLPFHGLLDVNPMNMTEGNIKFDGPTDEFSVTQNDQLGWSIFFKVKTDQYLYQLNIDISNDGKAVIVIKSPQRSTMTYWGEVY